MFKKTLIIALSLGTLVACAAENAKKPLKVLTIGNSFSVSLVHEWPKVAKAMDLPLDYCSIQIGGCSLERHWVNASKTESNGIQPTHYSMGRYVNGEKVKGGMIEIAEALTLDKWDIVSIQQCSGKSWVPESYHPFGDDLVKFIRTQAPQAEIIVQETWSYTPFDGRLAKWGIDQNEMYDKLHAAYAAFAKGYSFRVVPMGTAVQAWRKALPVKYTENSFGGDVAGGRYIKESERFVQDKNGKWIPRPGKRDPKTGKSTGGCDRFHLNEDGEYFQALVWTAKLFDVDVTKCPYKPAELSEEKAALMKKVVEETVRAK